MRRLLGSGVLVCALAVSALGDGGSSQPGKSCDPATQVCASSTNTASVSAAVLEAVRLLLSSLGITIK